MDAAGLGCFVVLFAVIYAQPWPALVRAGWLEVSGLDVSQGDSLLVVFPRGTTMLVDAGGFPGMERMAHKPQVDIGEEVVSPYLWWRRIHRLDYVVLTHGHSDHMAELPLCWITFGQGNYGRASNRIRLPGRWWRNTPRAMECERCSCAGKRSPFSIDGVEVRVLAPSSDYQPGPNAKTTIHWCWRFAWGSAPFF